MKKTILIALPLTEEQKNYFVNSIAGYESDFELVFAGTERPPEEEPTKASVLIGYIGPNQARRAVCAEWIQLASAGSDALTAPGVLRDNVLLTSAVGAYGLSVSEHMVAQTFYMIRNFGEYSRNQADRLWQSAGPVSSVEGSVIAVLGLGNIGGDYARKVKALGAYVIGLRKSSCDKPDYVDEQYTIAELDQVLPRADIVAMVLPGGDGTYHIMNEERLRLMKPASFLLNAGRGNAIDADALKKVLREGRLKAAALDVTDPEPLPADDELWSMENVFITPHVAGGLWLPETLNRITKIAGDNLAAWLGGRPLKNVVLH